MARVILPLMSHEAHGTIAGGMTFATNKGGQYVKITTPKKDPRTPAQVKVRQAYGEIATEWKELNEDERGEWRATAGGKGLSGYNLYFKDKWPMVYNP